MPIFCRKIVHSLKNTLLTCIFFQIFYKKTPAVMSIFGPKNVNSVETTLYFESKTSIGCPFFFKKCPKIFYNNYQKKSNTTSKYTLISSKKNVKNVKKVQHDFKIPYNIHQKKRKKTANIIFSPL